MSQKRTYKQYSAEFKEEAVALVTDQGYTIPEAAKSLGINTNMLYRWKDKLEAKNSGNQVTETEREELLRLRKENRNLRMEKEILKKASAFFAKEMK
ncbi:transposase [Nitrincola sp. A-D6]|jgi:transposase|nr:transposase [Nitrincola sp. A-D6]